MKFDATKKCCLETVSSHHKQDHRFATNLVNFYNTKINTNTHIQTTYIITISTFYTLHFSNIASDTNADTVVDLSIGVFDNPHLFQLLLLTYKSVVGLNRIKAVSCQNSKTR
jgi:hypothetical protein